jgi:hypothetical protein
MIASVSSLAKHLKNLRFAPLCTSYSSIAVRGGVMKAFIITQPRQPLLYASQYSFADNKDDGKKDTKLRPKESSFGSGQQEKNLKDQKSDPAWEANKAKEKKDFIRQENKA